MVALVVLLIFVAIALVAAVVFWRQVKRRRYHLWLPSYWRTAGQRRAPRPTTRHILLTICDHFEPGHNTPALREWLDRYHEIVSRHRDADGRYPQRSFFYPIEQFHDDQIVMIRDLCRAGMGEIEMHLHHENDTSESVTRIYREGLANFARFGIAQTVEDPAQTRFAFVHGNWALDNGAAEISPNPCGVNDELRILSSLGCFIDCTFPALWSPAQPRRINSIYYATDHPKQPKSYDDGVPVEVGASVNGDLMLLQGPLAIDWSNWQHKTHPTIEHGDLSAASPLYPGRVDLWLRANVHVVGRPEWVFVKLHAHSMHRADWPQVIGQPFEDLLQLLESRYNDGTRFVLHYVTARESYNIIKSAEGGRSGDPSAYRDFLIPPYRANRPMS